MTIELINIIIFYNNLPEITDYIERFALQEGAKSVGLVIVVNSSNSEDCSILKTVLESHQLNFWIYFPNENLGYLNGAIYGYHAYITEMTNKPEWVLISNTDISFPENDIFERFCLNRYASETWVVGPSVYSLATKSFSNPQYIERYSVKLLNRNIFIFSHPVLAYLFDTASKFKAILLKKNKKSSCYVFSVHGCFFFIRSQLADYLMDNPFKAKLYSEEGYISNIVYSLNQKVFYDSTINVEHHENAVTKFLGIKQKAKYIRESLKIIQDEFYS